MYTNPLFFVSVIILFVYTMYFIIVQDSFGRNLLGLVVIPQEYRMFMLYMAIANIILSYFFERVVITKFNNYYNEVQSKTKANRFKESLEYSRQ